MTVRRVLLKLHLIVGCAAAPLLAGLGLTGALLVFEPQLEWLLNRRLLDVPGTGPRLSFSELSDRLERAMPGYRVAGLGISERRTEAWSVQLASPAGELRNLLVDPDDGRVMGEASALRGAMGQVHQFHTRLLAGQVGRTLVGWGGVSLVLLAITGLILWWPGKILRVTWSGSRRRIIFGLHSALGGITWAALLLLGMTGIGIHWNQPLLARLAAILGEQVPPPFPREAPGCDSAHATVPLAAMISTAMAVVPGARPTSARLEDGGAPARIIFKYPEDHTPAGRTNVFVSPCTGEVVEARSTRTAPVSYRAMSMWNRAIHTGDLWGWPTRILAALISLSLPVMALTGPMLWWTRRKRSSR